MLVNTVDVQETLCVFDITAHWLSVCFRKQKNQKSAAGSR